MKKYRTAVTLLGSPAILTEDCESLFPDRMIQLHKDPRLCVPRLLGVCLSREAHTSSLLEEQLKPT